MLNALRLPGGFTEDALHARTGLDLEQLADGLARARAMRLLRSPRSGRWQPTERGLRYLNDLQALFL